MQRGGATELANGNSLYPTAFINVREIEKELRFPSPDS